MLQAKVCVHKLSKVENVIVKLHITISDYMRFLSDLFVWIVCSQVESSLPDVEIQHHHPNITVQLHERFELNCTIRSIGNRGKVEWKYNDNIINSTDTDNITTINSMYDRELCGFISTLVINNFTTANEGLYSCNASQPTTNSSSDSVYVLAPSTGK